MADTTFPKLTRYGAASARPAASVVATGTLYSATDTGAVTQSDGASWNTWATIGAPLAFGSNSNSVGGANSAGAHSSNSRADHVHMGVGSISHTSNTWVGPVTLVAQGSIGITKTDANTIAINAVAGTSSSGGTVPTMIRGRVNADGTKASGSGFTSSKTATGKYTITFTSAFAAAPAVLVQAIVDGGGAGGTTVTALIDDANLPTVNDAHIQMVRSGGSAFNDTAFMFLAISV